jgi:hypothetical protein
MRRRRRLLPDQTVDRHTGNLQWRLDPWIAEASQNDCVRITGIVSECVQRGV